MKNRLLIFVSQTLPSQVRGWLLGLRSAVRPQGSSGVSWLEGVGRFVPADCDSKLRALVLLHPSAWLTAIRQHPNIELYNHAGFTYSLVKALNENGYVVDLADTAEARELTTNYDLVIGHGGHCRKYIEQLPAGTPVYQYISGLYWKAFEAESDARYQRFFGKHGIAPPATHRRDIKELIDGLEYLNQRAEVLFSIHCPRMVAAYGPYARKFHFTGLGAYLDERFLIDQNTRDFEEGRNNFIYVGGTGGNLQKGLDLLIEAFVQKPDLHLYIYCKVEEEILRFCGKELAAKNIHYIYHWKYPPFHGKLKKLLETVNFSVHAPINIGMGTAFMATLGVGLIPVGYVDLADPGESAVLTDSWQVDSLMDCIGRASRKSPEWCREAAALSRRKYAEHCDPEVVERNLRSLFSQVGRSGLGKGQ